MTNADSQSFEIETSEASLAVSTRQVRLAASRAAASPIGIPYFLPEMRDKEILDYTLVPLGILILLIYHAWLLRQIIRRPTTTVVGINAINRRLWVRAMMEDTSKNGVLAVQTLRNSIMASTLLASTAIMLSSAIAALMSSSSSNGGFCPAVLVAGSNTKLTCTIKLFSILVCFLLAFFLNVQSIRYLSHASMLINVPSSLSKGRMEFVWRVVNRGSYFWSLGLRAFYFSFPLFLWIFGAVHLFLCCVLMVFLLYFLDFEDISMSSDNAHLCSDDYII
ncbi:hypothetical protein M569_07560 [Genlisea aurea]|uniref:DUF599 domain-containing protein n=1 Tax=Genlisea aurea TaxID=192259 RepID=S8CJH9_9LAMI|nr:hypothetical protein M569_07560 [Genlisea aurea]